MSMEITEAQVMQRDLDRLRVFNFYAYHTKDSRFSEPGFPDIIALRDGKQVIIECKDSKRKVTTQWKATRTGRILPSQKDWLDYFSLVPGCKCYVSRPGGWRFWEVNNPERYKL